MQVREPSGRSVIIFRTGWGTSLGPVPRLPGRDLRLWRGSTGGGSLLSWKAPVTRARLLRARRSRPRICQPAYPLEYRRAVTLRDGRRVLIRPILPGDASALAEAIQSADDDTIRRRYLGGHPQVTPELLDFLTTVDYTSRFALVAVEPASGRGVAIARYEPAEPADAADVAIAVTPGWRGAGLASELLRMLARAASERGIHTFTGTYFAENRPVTALIHGVGELADQGASHGIARFSVTLRPPDPGS